MAQCYLARWPDAPVILSSLFVFDLEVVSASGRATLEWKVLNILGGRSLEGEW